MGVERHRRLMGSTPILTFPLPGGRDRKEPAISNIFGQIYPQALRASAHDMAKAKKRSRPGRRLERKDEAWFPLRRPALLAALGLAGWAPAGAADSLDGTNGFRLNGVTANDFSGGAVSNAGDVNGDGLADLLIGGSGADPNGADSGASYVVFGRNTAQTGAFAASLNLSSLDGTNGFRLAGVAAGDYSGEQCRGCERRWDRGPPHRGLPRRPQRQPLRGELCGLRAEHRPDRRLPGEPQSLYSRWHERLSPGWRRGR